ncbi:MAG: phosphatase PAP2 family protein [Treponema sp.]|jgi:membrane-associated phospholipid phosphatase|nr:phosphatase PAP2 family protein [Treponema sp.]
MNDGVTGFLTAADSLPLNGIYRWGLELIKQIQSIESPPLTALIKILTGGGSAFFFIPVLLFIIWFADEKKGLRLGLLLLFSAWLNFFLKNLFKQPRPCQFDPSVGLIPETGYGLPSAHSQLSLVFLLLTGFWLGKRSARPRLCIALGGLLALIVGFTRLYLGVHFPTDILAGWLTGGLILGFYALAVPRIEGFLNAGGSRLGMISCAVIALLMNALGPDIRLGGLFLGFGTGYHLMRLYFPFSARTKAEGRAAVLALRCTVGILGTVITGLVFCMLSRGEAVLSQDYHKLARFILYGLLGFWPTAAAPWLFLRLRPGPPPADTPGESRSR